LAISQRYVKASFIAAIIDKTTAIIGKARTDITRSSAHRSVKPSLESLADAWPPAVEVRHWHEPLPKSQSAASADAFRASELFVLLNVRGLPTQAICGAPVEGHRS
jgi:hypothetical protein